MFRLKDSDVLNERYRSFFLCSNVLNSKRFTTFDQRRVGAALLVTKKKIMERQRTLNLRGQLMDLSTPQVMGIINVTPDSFYAGSRRSGEKAITERIEQILREGGTLVDVGGCSTRPGNRLPDEAEEMERLRPALELLSKHYPQVPISVDTFRSRVARMAVEEYGAAIVNDISGGLAEEQMFRTVGGLGVAYILMHISGTVETMHEESHYEPNVESAVADFFIRQVAALRKEGVNDIILDAGFGFSKSPEDNYRLMAHCADAFRDLGLPLLVGVSRKRMIWRLLDSSPDEALNGTTVLNTIALMLDGADILRVHDVREAVEAVKLVAQIKTYLSR